MCISSCKNMKRYFLSQHSKNRTKKAGYTATQVACRWANLEFYTEAVQNPKNAKKNVMSGWTEERATCPTVYAIKDYVAKAFPVQNNKAK